MEKENTSQKEEILKEAIDAINCLDKSNIKEMKSFSKPPPAVKLTMQCVAILFGVKPKKTDKV